MQMSLTEAQSRNEMLVGREVWGGNAGVAGNQLRSN